MPQPPTAATGPYLVGLVGNGVSRSLSPALHMREARHHGLSYAYAPIDLLDQGLPASAIGELVRSARQLGFSALNITHPCKQEVIARLDRIDPDATALGAVNTVVFEGDDAVGYNTDWSGFAKAFTRGLPQAATGDVVQLGAGGAGAAVAHALLNLGADRLTVVDVDPPRSRHLADQLSRRFGAGRAVAGTADMLPDLLEGADGLAHCTPTGMADHPGMPLPAGLLHPGLWVADIVYRPLETELLVAAAQAGCERLDGAAMAVFQAADAFALITGREADHTRMLDHIGELVETTQPSEEHKMRTSIATVCLSGTLVDKLHAAADAGFDGVEIFENDLIASPVAPEEIRRIAGGLGLTIDLYQPLRDFEGVDEDQLARNLRRAEGKLDLMQRLGASMVLVCSNVGTATYDDDGRAAEQLAALADRAGRRGLAIAYEALAWGRYVDDYEHAWRIVELADHPALGTCLDSFHILARGSDPAGIEKIPAEKLFFCQLADAPLLSLDVLSWSRHHRLFPGQGGLDVAGLVGHVLRAGYTGPWSLEIFNDVFRQSDAHRTAVDGMRSLVALQDHSAVRSGAADAVTPVELAKLPEPVASTGFAFAELLVRNPWPATELLRTLGFTCSGDHRTKPVQLWTQGRAHVIVNRDAPTSAEVGALGFETSDADGAAERAEALRSPVLPRLRGPQEAELRAVAAPDGTQVFFCPPGETSWRTDFVPLPTETAGGEQDGPSGPTGPIGVTGIDHVALAQPWQHFDEAALFYRSVLDLEPYESLEIADPYGLMRSRAFASRDGTVRLALNVAPGTTGAATQHAATQHIAFAVDDLLGAADVLHERQAPVLGVPANYYDDLRTRHDLAPELVGRMQRLNVLYDADEHGEFLHLYTAAVGHVFFEIVQRTGGYTGYGASNAPVRLAAQHTS